ncbi:hypothetical protein CHUAL_001435 [Chamberlinius hualienensis]
MADFKPLNLLKFSADSNQNASPESIYWSAFNFPTTIKERGSVTCIDFPQLDSNQFAVTSSCSVKIYSTITREPISTLSKFRETAYGATFRRDGKLVAAGGEEGKVRVFEVESKSIIREFNGHTSAVHLSKFTNDCIHLLSFGDDKKIVVWDVPGETAIHSFTDHKDYVRAGTVSKSSNDIFISGSYDHSVKMFDLRAKKSVLSVDHGAPVESVLLFPSGGVFVSSGGEMMKVWDISGSGKLLASVSTHHKLITCLSFASQYKKILSGSLDRHVKIYDTSTYQVCHTLESPSPILSLGISSNDGTLAVGMSCGLLSIQNRKFDLNETEAVDIPQPRKLEPPKVNHQQNETKYNTRLKHFECTKALDIVLRNNVNKNPDVAMTVIQDLIRRGALKAAVAERHDHDLDIMLIFIAKNMGNSRFCRVMLDFIETVIDVYGERFIQNEKAINLMKRIHSNLNAQVRCMSEKMKIGGMIETLISTIKLDNNSGNMNETAS